MAATGSSMPDDVSALDLVLTANVEYRDGLAAMNTGPAGRVATVIRDACFSLVTTVLARFGRAAAEVGAVIAIVVAVNALAWAARRASERMAG
jgi:tungstate transport system permease protein